MNVASEILEPNEISGDGAWDILLKWLQEALKEDNYAFLLELLNVYSLLPVRLEQLTQNVCPKLINSLTKRCDHEASHVKRKKLEHETKSLNKEVLTNETTKDEKKRRTTVKIPPNNMRTAGIEENTAQGQPKSRSDILAKKSSNLTAELPIESFHQKITVTPAEPRKGLSNISSTLNKLVELHESSDFINALTTTPCPVNKDESSMEISDQSCVAESSPASSRGMGSRKSSLSSLYSAFPADNKPKKRVSWADEDKLQIFHYFELDESERVNVNRVSIEDIRRKEHSMERQLFKRSYEDTEVDSQKWYSPYPLERIFLVEPGCKSIERQIQLERERFVLQAMYFTRDSIPQTPEEPDMEIVEHVPPLQIPLDDLTVYESVDKNAQINSEKLLVQDSVGNSQVSFNSNFLST
ncbi:unnamed protein product [Trichobilharzia regenti]|nr:unnamed protein product [Trichobilharzia regenti]